jgi:hypothetical protein
MRDWQGQPRKRVEFWLYTNTGEKKSETFDRWAVGCSLVVLKMTCSQSHYKIQAPFSATPCES